MIDNSLVINISKRKTGNIVPNGMNIETRIKGFSEIYKKKTDYGILKFVDITFLPCGDSKGFDKFTSGIRIPEPVDFEYSDLHRFIEAADDKSNINNYAKYDLRNLIRKKVIVNVKVFKVKNQDYVNIKDCFNVNFDIDVAHFDSKGKE